MCNALIDIKIGAPLAARIAQTYGLKSTDIIINQSIAHTQYLSFRYFLQGEPFRYADVLIGLDQAEVVFSNPATVLELTNEVHRALKIIGETVAPTANGTYFEATLHC